MPLLMLYSRILIKVARFFFLFRRRITQVHTTGWQPIYRYHLYGMKRNVLKIQKTTKRKCWSRIFTVTTMMCDVVMLRSGQANFYFLFFAHRNLSKKKIFVFWTHKINNLIPFLFFRFFFFSRLSAGRAKNPDILKEERSNNKKK